jgi:hypothetical protein
MCVEQNLNKIFYHQEIKVIVKGGLHGLTCHSQLVDKLFEKMNKCCTMGTWKGFQLIQHLEQMMKGLSTIKNTFLTNFIHSYDWTCKGISFLQFFTTHSNIDDFSCLPYICYCLGVRVCSDDNMYLWIVLEAFKKLEEKIVIFWVV